MRSTLTHLYESSREQLRAVAARYVGDEAEDVVQDAFVRALRYASAFRGDATPLTWLHRIVVNASIDHCRRRKRQDPSCLPPPPAMENARNEESLAVRHAIGDLTPDHRRVFVMYEVIGLTHSEIATSLAIPVGTSKGRLSTARVRLQRALARKDGRRRSVRRRRNFASRRVSPA